MSDTRAIHKLQALVVVAKSGEDGIEIEHKHARNPGRCSAFPFLALAKALIERGHTVQLVAPERFGDFVKQQGVHFVGLPAEFLDLLDKPEGKAAIAKGGGFSAGLKLLKYMGPLMETTLNLEWMAAKEFSPDVIVYHPKSLASPPYR